MRTLSRLQEPPRLVMPGSNAHTVCGGPPVAATRITLSTIEYPSVLLSGDQNGKDAPSVPASGRAASESIGRTHSMRVPVPSRAVNARVRPSGEITGAMAPLRDPAENVMPSGGAMEKLATAGGTERPRYHAAVAARRATTRIAVAIGHTIPSLRGGGGAGATAAVAAWNDSSSM